MSTSDSPCCADSLRKTRLQVAGRVLGPVAGGWRLIVGPDVLVAEPSDFTSSNSRAYLRLVSGSGPLVRSSAALGIRNGLTSFSQAAGSFAIAGSTGFHWPGPEPTGNRNAPKRPSSFRAAIIAAAAALPTAIPRRFDALSEIEASEAAYCGRAQAAGRARC